MTEMANRSVVKMIEMDNPTVAKILKKRTRFEKSFCTISDFVKKTDAAHSEIKFPSAAAQTVFCAFIVPMYLLFFYVSDKIFYVI